MTEQRDPRDHLVLAGQVPEHAGPGVTTQEISGGRAAGCRFVRHHGAVQSMMAGIAPVLSSEAAGIGSGSMSRIRSWISLGRKGLSTSISY